MTTNRGGALAGVRVLELAGQGPAPFATMMLAEMGADVVRVDRASSDALFAGNPAGDLLNRGKRSVMIDLKAAAGVECFLRLADRANVVVEGFRPGTVERLGIGPAECFERNPALVYGRVTGYGQSGPLSQRAGHDVNYIALTGLLHAIGEHDRPPQIPLNVAGDLGGGGVYLVIGILAALREAERTGQGQVVDAAIVDSAANLLTSVHSMMAMDAWVDERASNVFDGGAPFYTVYETSDHRYVAVGAIEPKFYAELLSGLGLPDDPADQHQRAMWPSTRDRIAATFATRTRDAWTDRFEGSDACVSPVLSLTEAADHPHLAARGSLGVADGVLQARPAPRLSRSTAKAVGGPCLPGSATRQTLHDWGISNTEELLDSGVAWQTFD